MDAPPEYEEELLTRRERLRLHRQEEHSAPARISLRAGAVVVVLVGLLSWITVSWVTSRSDTEPLSEVVPLQEASIEPIEDQPGGEDPAVLIVHVAGAVKNPQVVQLEPGDRVIDAVEAVGGMTDGAAPEGINLAAAAEDGTLIFVPTAEELESGDVPSAAAGAEGGGASAEQGPTVDINTAEAAELEQLPGIGPALADRIITYRETHGAFSAFEELAAVSGIGPAILENIVDDVTW